MKKSIKTLALWLCVSLLLCSLAACGEKEEKQDGNFSLSTLSPVDPSTVPESAKEFSQVKPGVYTVLCHSPASGLLSVAGAGEDTVEREIYLRNAELYEKYSIELKELNITGDTVDFVRNSTLSGRITYDVASLTYRDAALLTVTNSLCPLSELGGYYQNMEMFSDELSFEGKQYIETFDIFAPRVDGTYAVAINRELMEKTGLRGTVVSDARRGRFTYEYLTKLCKEGRAVSYTEGGLAALWVGGGESFYQKGEGGVPEYKMPGEETEAVYLGIKTLVDSGVVRESEKTFGQSATETLFTVGTVGMIEESAREGLDLLILPLPKTQEDREYRSYVSPTAHCTVVPAGDSEKNSVAFALTGMLYKYDLDGPRRAEYLERVQGESAEAGVFDMILETRSFDLPAIYNIGGFYEFLEYSLKYNLLPNAFLEGIDDRVQTAVVAIEIIKENGR